MHLALRTLAGIICLAAGLLMLALGEHAAAWAPDPSAAGVVLCVASGFLLSGPCNAWRRARRDGNRDPRP